MIITSPIIGGCGFFVRSFLLYPSHPGLFRSAGNRPLILQLVFCLIGPAGSVHLTSNASGCSTVTQADIVLIDMSAGVCVCACVSNPIMCART